MKTRRAVLRLLALIPMLIILGWLAIGAGPYAGTLAAQHIAKFESLGGCQMSLEQSTGVPGFESDRGLVQCDPEPRAAATVCEPACCGATATEQPLVTTTPITCIPICPTPSISGSMSVETASNLNQQTTSGGMNQSDFAFNNPYHARGRRPILFNRLRWRR